MCYRAVSSRGTRNSSQERVACGRGKTGPPGDKTGECPLWRGKAIAAHIWRGKMGFAWYQEGPQRQKHIQTHNRFWKDWPTSLTICPLCRQTSRPPRSNSYNLTTMCQEARRSNHPNLGFPFYKSGVHCDLY